tara:strand:+ start:2056 stop:2514 length:459 start_codon:yes stop_codon:yes gene_type:complete
MKATIDLNYLLIPIGFLIHAIAISASGFLLIFCNDVKIIGLVSFIVFLVFVQTLMYGCLLNKLENNATMKILTDIAVKYLNLKCKTSQLIEDLPKILVAMTLSIYLIKFSILVMFSYENIKFIEAGIVSFMFLNFTDSLKKFKYVYNQIIRN